MEKHEDNTPDMQTTQSNLEELYSKHQLMDVLRAEFADLSDDPFMIDVVCQIYLHKQADIPTMVGLFSPKWGEPQDVAQLLDEAVMADLVDFDMDRERFIVKYVLTPEVEEMLARYQFPLPMVVQPKHIHNNVMGSGYLNQKGSIVLNGSDVFRDEDMCLDHLNRANSVALSINMDVVASAEGMRIAPTRKDGEMFADFSKRKRQADAFYETTTKVMEDLMVLGNEFWLTHKYDRRGRTYSVGYHVNTQGDDYRKAVIELSNKELIT